MRSRAVIEADNVVVFNHGNGVLSEDKKTTPGQTLILEVLLDIRDLLSKDK